MYKTINQRGFAAIEAVLIFVIVAIIGGTGYYVYNANKEANQSLAPTQAAVSKSSGSIENLTKTYSDDFGHFSVKYPADWKLSTKPATEHESEAVLTSPKGSVLSLSGDLGGKGGQCPPGAADKPFKAGNACASQEYLSSENLDIRNVYYSKQVNKPDGSSDFTYEPADIVLVTKHFADPAGKSSYTVGLTQSTPTD